MFPTGNTGLSIFPKIIELHYFGDTLEAIYFKIILQRQNSRRNLCPVWQEKISRGIGSLKY